MSDSGLDQTITRTPEQARADIARRDRERWFPARHGSGGFGILSALTGREVALCAAEADRDYLAQVARNFYVMRDTLAAIQGVLDQEIEDRKHSGNSEDWSALQALSDKLHEALRMAQAVKP